MSPYSSMSGLNGKQKLCPHIVDAADRRGEEGERGNVYDIREKRQTHPGINFICWIQTHVLLFTRYQTSLPDILSSEVTLYTGAEYEIVLIRCTTVH
ncbi:hypothetical protein M8J77_013552 [Diaphorina citri]|nr:hypothetical protein M8J77_013552 [Diaphorina citri]